MKRSTIRLVSIAGMISAAIGGLLAVSGNYIAAMLLWGVAIAVIVIQHKIKQ